MQALTRRQQQILDFIQQWRQLRDSMPTRQEIAAHFGFRSPNAVTGHLRLLRKKGVIASEPGKARSLRITSPLAKLRNHVVDNVAILVPGQSFSHKQPQAFTLGQQGIHALALGSRQLEVASIRELRL